MTEEPKILKREPIIYNVIVRLTSSGLETRVVEYFGSEGKDRYNIANAEPLQYIPKDRINQAIEVANSHNEVCFHSWCGVGHVENNKIILHQKVKNSTINISVKVAALLKHLNTTP